MIVSMDRIERLLIRGFAAAEVSAIIGNANDCGEIFAFLLAAVVRL
jgi:hypothetical protein